MRNDRLQRPLVAMVWIVLLAFAEPIARAQGSSGPPVRQLGPRLAITKDSLGSISGIRQLSDGRVIVNDVGRHRLLLFDSTLSHPAVIADSTSTTNKAYGRGAGGIIAYRADTTLFVDALALSMLVIDPRGAIVRTIAPPRPSDASILTNPNYGAAADGAGRIVYRLPGGKLGPDPATRSSGLPSYTIRDTSFILRGDLATHVIDTVGFIGIPYANRLLGNTPNPDGSRTLTWVVAIPIPIMDDWAVVADGSVAMVRGLDYHIDWVNADGTHSSTAKIAHDWHPLSDSEKTAIIDSARRSTDSTVRASLNARARADSIDRANGRLVVPFQKTLFVWPEPSDLPDYQPVIRRGAPAQNISAQTPAVRADADNNLWIRQAGPSVSGTMTAAAPVYDIVNREGRLIDRVQLPPSLTLVGFGRGVVYLTSREASGTVLVKYRVR